jgi:hypothetical protein
MSKRFRLSFILAVVLCVAMATMAIVVLKRPPRPSARANALMVIMPYRHAGTWVFDDASVGLKQEPFVAGIPEMIDAMVVDIPDAEKGFRLLFSAQPFPGYTHKLEWRRGDSNGNWYYCEQYGREGWLCPGLFKYYDEAPKEIYVKAEKK